RCSPCSSPPCSRIWRTSSAWGAGPTCCCTRRSSCCWGSWRCRRHAPRRRRSAPRTSPATWRSTRRSPPRSTVSALCPSTTDDRRGAPAPHRPPGPHGHLPARVPHGPGPGGLASTGPRHRPGDLGRDRRHRRDDRTAGGDRLVAAAVHRSRCGHGPGGARSRPLRHAAAPDRARRAPADRAPPHGARGMGRAAHRGARRDRGADRSACRPGRCRPGALRHAVPPLGAEAHPRHRQRLEPRAQRRGELRPHTDVLPRGLPCSGRPRARRPHPDRAQRCRARPRPRALDAGVGAAGPGDVPPGELGSAGRRGGRDPDPGEPCGPVDPPLPRAQPGRLRSASRGARRCCGAVERGGGGTAGGRRSGPGRLGPDRRGRRGCGTAAVATVGLAGVGLALLHPNAAVTALILLAVVTAVTGMPLWRRQPWLVAVPVLALFPVAVLTYTPLGARVTGFSGGLQVPWWASLGEVGLGLLTVWPMALGAVIAVLWWPGLVTTLRSPQRWLSVAWLVIAVMYLDAAVDSPLDLSV